MALTPVNAVLAEPLRLKGRPAGDGRGRIPTWSAMAAPSKVASSADPQLAPARVPNEGRAYLPAGNLGAQQPGRTRGVPPRAERISGAGEGDLPSPRHHQRVAK